VSKDRIPYFDFYPSDFMHGVRGLSAQEVGVYTMMLCRIYEENGPVEFHVLRLATYCGMRESTFKKTVDTLVNLGKLDIADGKISNRRAESEISSRSDKLKLNSKAGKASAEKREQKQRSKSTGVQQAFNHTDTDTDTDTDTEATLSSVAAPRGENSDLDLLQRKLVEAVGEGNIQSHAALVVGPMVELITGGVSLELDILPCLRSRSSSLKRPAGSWNYFVPGIRDAYERRIGAAQNLPKQKPLDETGERWTRRLKFARDRKLWSTAELGPMPGTPGCRVPMGLLLPEDGEDWADMAEQRSAA
jgi:uncharacterized protein YdaU (DUF1376 family)